MTLVEEHQPDLAILDIKMPGMDGLRAAREITSRHQVAVLLLTAFSQRDLIEEARDAGVSAYLVKPFQPRELLPAVADVLSKARQDWAIEAEHSGRRRPRTRSPPAGVVDEAKADPDGARRPARERGVRLHPAHGHAEPGPHARRGPAGRRRHADPVVSGGWPTSRSARGPLLLLDGMSLAFRAYFALPDTLATTAGVVTNAVHGFTSPCWQYLIREQQPSAAGRRLRRPRATRSATRCSRTTRPAGPQTPWLLPPQFDMIREVMDALAIPVIEAPGFEADDVIATLATEAAERELRGRDRHRGPRQLPARAGPAHPGALQQARRERLLALRRGRHRRAHAACRPRSTCCWPSLRGDPSDNLPGIPGVGEKTAAKLLTNYGDLDGVFTHWPSRRPSCART